mgnify:CR=1 FL=1
MLQESIRTNLVLASLKRHTTGLFLDEKRIQESGEGHIRTLRIKTPSIDVQADVLQNAADGEVLNFQHALALGAELLGELVLQGPEVMQSLGQDIDPRKAAGTFGMGVQQMIEIGSPGSGPPWRR